MTNEQLNNTSRSIMTQLAILAGELHPQEFRAVLGGMIGTITGSMTEDYWQGFRKHEPCGEPGCDCHIMLASSEKFFEDVRADYLRHEASQKTVTE